MYLKPNAHFGEFDNFDRSGLWLLGDGDALKVADVAAGSAGARAGLRAGDRITAIAGEGAAKQPLPHWRALLAEAPAGTGIALKFMRDGAEQTAQLTLADRIPPKAK
jgi:S1-C subfamily serine protease